MTTAQQKHPIFIRADKVYGEGAKGYLVGWFEPLELAHNIQAAKHQKVRMILSGQPTPEK